MIVRRNISAVLSFVLFANLTVGTALQLTAVISLPVIVGASKCDISKDQLVASGKDVLDVVQDKAVIAALQAVSPEAVAKLLASVPTATNLLAWIKTGDFTNAIAAVNSLFPMIDEIAALLHASPKVLGIVALANIALHFIINHVQANAQSVVRASSSSRAVQTALSYAAQPTWGCDYHKNDKRCQ